MIQKKYLNKTFKPVEKTEKINHHKQVIKSMFLTSIAVQNYTLTTKRKDIKMLKKVFKKGGYGK